MTPENEYKQVALPLFIQTHQTDYRLCVSVVRHRLVFTVELNLIAKCFMYTPMVVIRMYERLSTKRRPFKVSIYLQCNK